MLAKLTTRGVSMLLLLLVFSLSAIAQKKITGKVTGTDAKPVFGATVAVKGTNLATSTSEDGTFSIDLPAGKNTLVFSSVGFEVSEYNVDQAGGKTTVDIKPETSHFKFE